MNSTQRCQELRLGDESSIDTVARVFANRYWRIRRDPHRGTMIVSVGLPMESVKRRCWDSHMLVHEGGFSVGTDFQNNWIFLRPDGIAVPDTGYHSRDMLDTETGEISSLYNNPPAGALLSGAENFVKEPPVPVYLH